MRQMKTICMVSTVVMACLLPSFASEGFDEIVRIVKSGVDETNLIDYVNSSPIAFSLTVDEILYLNDLGLSPVAIQAITSHGQNPDVAMAGDVVPLNNRENTPVQEQAESGSTGMEVQAPVPESTPAAVDVVQEAVVAAPVITTPSADQADYSLFYEGLAPYGNWLDLDGEWCWQPTAVIVDHSWSPYCQRGHWVYSDCGWAWESAYSWGWAPFHYGRWRHHTRYGWIWRPDRVWGPAWVSWRYSDSAIGWAPLPPEVTFDAGLGLCYGGRPVRSDFDCGLGWDAFTFVPIKRFHDESRLERHRFDRSRAESAFHSATMVASRVSSQNGRIVNFGPPPGHITSITHQEIHPVTLIDQSVHAGAPIPRSRTSGSTLAFYRPQVSATTHETPRQVVLRSQAREQERRSSTRHDEVFTIQSAPTSVVVEQNRGRQSRSPQSAPVFKVTPAIQDNHPRVQSHPMIEDVTRQRQAEEAAARLQEESRRRADDLIRVQNMDRLRTQEQQRQREIADQQSRAAAISRQQEEQRQAIRVQREAEETAARWQVQQARTVQQAAPAVPRVREPYRAVSEALDYGNSTQTGAASTRGAYSRSTNTGNSTPVSSREGNRSWKR